MNEPKRKLKINMIDLEAAFEHHDEYEISYYLDLETGEVVLVTSDDRRNLEEVNGTYADPETGEVDWSSVLPQLDIPDWQQEGLVKASQVEKGFGTHYIAIPQVGSNEGYEEMAEFIDTVTNPYLAARLEKAISGKGPFRKFKDALLDYPRERERWFKFKDERMRQRILDWLEEAGIELI